MTTYGIAHLRDVVPGAGITEYLERIDATLEPFGGRFVVHGDRPRVVEGEFDAALVIIAFPDRAAAEAWYASPAYRAILPLRTENSRGDVFLVDGVGPDHRATDVLALLGLPAGQEPEGSASRAAAT
ncbi:DUF1330 domain-containing protein [Pseudonocardia sp. CA-107938]|uniref:DUF1330 domain-containing protein n=1 Tax=Pseudonocardia sp. CA-107938 TaxID=3240021 RepID=UPI003D95061F